ncbi:MAG: hypothetical protein JWR84_954 [Caulobacter sp.]|nr:hypothetical protein [Caulobacter sp.]
MNGVTLSLLILGATIPMSALGFVAGLLAERITGAPGLRERVWGLALLAPVLAVVAVVLISPHLSRPAPPAGPVAAAADLNLGDVAVLAPQAADPLGRIGDLILLLGPVLLLSIILLGVLVAVGLLVRRHVRLGRLLAAAKPLDDADLIADLARQAAILKVRSPSLKASDQAGSPLLAGLIRPAIVIPRLLTKLPTPRLALICGHELAHLKRGDNPRAWAEGVLLAAMWFNPFMAMIQARLNAAREEHCDAIALSHADATARRAYAETLLETLRLSAGPEPQSAFIGAGRKTAMRLKAILKPHAPAGLGTKASVIAIAAALTLAVGGASIALAMQAAPERALAGRASSWRQSMQDNALAPKGVIDIVADETRIKNGVAYWSGRPAIRLTPATGDPRRDADLAGVRFLINGKPAPADFTPNSLDPKDIGVIAIKQRTSDDEGPTVINIVMAPEAPPAPPAPPARAPEPPPEPPTPPPAMTAPTPPTPPPPTLARMAPPAPVAPPAPLARAPTPPTPPPAPPAPPMPVSGPAMFESVPTGADVTAAYPRAALGSGISGRVVLVCKTTAAGSLTDCSTRGETPAGNGFAEAALKLAPKFKVRTVMPDGSRVPSRTIALPISFVSPDETPRPAPNAR